MSEKIGIGIIGLGGRGVKFAGKTFAALPDCRLVGLHDVAEEKIAAAQNILGDIPGTTDLDEFMQLPGLDAVVIASPDHVHAQHCLKALAHKKHVFLEKPMAQTIEDCDRMIEAWSGTGVVFMVGLELRYVSLMEDMKSLIEAGEVGRIITGTVIDNVSVGGDYYYHGRRRKKDYIKSLILEKGTHSLDLTNWLLDQSPVKVYCSGGLDVFGGDEPNDKRCRDCEIKDTCPYFIDYKAYEMDYGALIQPEDFCVYAQECDVDDNSLVTIDYDGGARICYLECHFTPEYSREFMFIGTGGKITGFYNNEQEFKISVWKRHTQKIDVYLPEKRPGGHGGGDAGIVRDFVRLIKAGQPALPGIVGARDSAAIAIAAADSAESGLPVEIPPIRLPKA